MLNQARKNRFSPEREEEKVEGTARFNSIQRGIIENGNVSGEEEIIDDRDDS